MASSKEIKSRIKGVKSTRKITRAMEMISAVKMRKAMASMQAVRPYAESALGMFRAVAAQAGHDIHPLLADRSIAAELTVVITSNRGLCGAFNTQVMRRVRQMVQEDRDVQKRFITIGRKGEAALRRMDADIVAAFPDAALEPSMEGLRAVTHVIVEEFLAGRADRVRLVYTDFVSAMRQEVRLHALLPMSDIATEEALEVASKKPLLMAERVIEPDPKGVLDRLVPHLITTTLFRAVLESNASQEAARMMAMRNASDAAKEMTDSLTLIYNQLRQAKVTQEIAELSAGMAAVEG